MAKLKKPQASGKVEAWSYSIQCWYCGSELKGVYHAKKGEHKNHAIVCTNYFIPRYDLKPVFHIMGARFYCGAQNHVTGRKATEK